jgi:hypothetical protein
MVMAIYWLLFAVAAVGNLRWVVYLFFGGIAFGAVNTLPGSINLLPATACVPLLTFRVLRTLGQPGAAMDCVLNWRRLGLLTGYMVVSFVVTVTAPVLFSGVPIMEMNNLRMGVLHFTPTNLTQIAYLIASYCVTLVVCVMIQSRDGRRLLAEGLIFGGGMLIVGGALDAVLGSGPLTMFKTANYAMILDAEILDVGARRVVGFYSEASVYGAATLAFASCLIFMRPAREFGGWLASMDVIVGLGLELMTYLSTSSGALAGLGVMVALQGWAMLANALATQSPAERGRAQGELLGALAVMVVVVIYLIAAPGILTKIYLMVDTMILKKSQTDSYVERSGWTRTTLHAVMMTYGYGIGAGASRASNWAVAVLASGGAMGAALMAAFLAKCMLATIRRGSSPVAFMGRGGRYAFLVSLVPAMGAATTADYGPVIATILAVMAGAAGAMPDSAPAPIAVMEPVASGRRVWRTRSIGMAGHRHGGPFATVA